MTYDFDSLVAPNKMNIYVWEEPQPDTRYVLGIDAATGIGSDYTSMHMWSCRIPFEQVAWYRSKHCSTVEGSELMIKMAKWYNNAKLVPERRYPGNTYIDNAIQVYQYPNIYQVEEHLDEDPNVSSKFGIATTEEWKNLLVNEAKRLIEAYDDNNNPKPKIVFHDQSTIEQFCTFVYQEDKSKMGAEVGSCDDDVMACMLAWHECLINPQAPRPKGVDRKRSERRAQMEYLMSKMSSTRELVAV